MSTKHTILVNTGSQILGKFVSGVVSFFTSIVLARSLGLAGYGDYTKIIAFTAFFYLFCDIGLNAAYLQLSAGDDSPRFKNTLFSVRVFLGIFLIFLSILLLVFLPGNQSQGYTSIVKLGIILFAPSILFQSLITSANAVFQKHLRYDYAATATSVGSVVTLACVWLSVIVLPPHVHLYAFITSSLLGIFITAGISLLYVRRLSTYPVISVNVTDAKRLIVLALPLGITLIFNVIYFHADSVILAISRPTTEVGIYGLAYKFFEFTLVIPTFFMNAVLPILISACTKGDTLLFRKQCTKSAIALTGVSVGIMVVGYVFAPFASLIRQDFVASIIPLRILLLSLPVFYLTSVTMWIMVVKKMHKTLMGIYGIMMLINIVLNILLVPTHGYMVAAWVTAVTELCILTASCAALWIHDKTTRNPVYSHT